MPVATTIDDAHTDGDGFLHFPHGFAWGTSTAAYQVEGATREGGRGECIWDVFARIPGKVRDGDHAEVACDHFHRFKEDVQLMKRLGLQHYRLSLSWSRIVPGGVGAVNEEGVAFYNALIDELLANGIQPFVTLLHFDLPMALQLEYDGWLGGEAVQDAFVEYARVCFARFGDRVTHWLTINEPWILALLGHGWGVAPPGRRHNPGTEPYVVAHNVLLAHAKADLNTILERLGGEEKIGNDNRATDAIYGPTMRVGRTLHFASNFLLDLLLSSTHRRKSVLLLGRPGSGKTTLIRDIARCLSESGENVCIIDTSNEIGGDGVVPHECIGWARRMMVKSLNDQARVMVECVQNHTVETLIVDEIGRKAEVNAADTVRQRGPRMIASAHGDFRSLIKNQDLKGLIGGVQTVIVGDEEARKNPLLGKNQAKRAGNPIFDVIVEFDEVHRGRCRIIWDVAEAVDTVLNGDAEYACETRFQTFGMRGVQVIQ